MHIILEGCDKTGKTTLANYLSKELGMPIKKFSAPTPTEDPLMNYAAFLVAETTPHIIDRFYLSELAYGPVKRGKSSITIVGKRLIEALIKEVDCMAIYCQRDPDHIMADFIKDNETFLTSDDILPILNQYQVELDSSTLHWNYYKIGDKMQLLADYYKINGGK